MGHGKRPCFQISSYPEGICVESQTHILFSPFFRYHACSLARNATFTGVLVTGGREGGLDGAASSELYDLATLTSVRVGDLVVPRFGHNMILLGERTFAMAGWGYKWGTGGGPVAGGMEQNSVEEFSLTSQEGPSRLTLFLREPSVD